MIETDLAKKMRALAATGHPRAAELIEKADAFDKAINDSNTPVVTARSVVGRWARARRVWSECSGEPLI